MNQSLQTPFLQLGDKSGENCSRRSPGNIQHPSTIRITKGHCEHPRIAVPAEAQVTHTILIERRSCVHAECSCFEYGTKWYQLKIKEMGSWYSKLCKCKGPKKAVKKEADAAVEFREVNNHPGGGDSPAVEAENVGEEDELSNRTSIANENAIFPSEGEKG